MAAENHIIPSKSIPKRKKENIRVFVHRKHLSSVLSHKSFSSQTNSMEHLTTIIEKNLYSNKKKSKNNKNIIVVNYKPVFVNSREQKPTTTTTTTDTKSPLTPPNTRRGSKVIPNSNQSLNRQSVSFDDADDPFTYIEMMYQQLFTEDGQLRSGTEPTILANCVKQIVTQSRRNSISPNIQQHKLSSRRSSKRSSIDNVEHHQQQLHAYLNSYYHHQQRTSINQMTMNNFNSPLSIDDTDNEDFDTFSDLNSYRKTIHYSPPPSIDEDITQTDSKLLSSSGYQSLKSPQPIISHSQSDNDQHYCPNCIQTPQTTSTISLIQPVREIIMKYVNVLLISKNILLVPLFMFLLRQRSIHLGN